MTLSLRGSSIPTDGSGRIVITDINPDGDPNNEDALICQSELSVSANGDWYLHPTQQTTETSDRIQANDPRGWLRNRDTFTISGSETGRLVRLRRYDSIASEGRALEGVFTCNIPGDSNTPVSVGIYYPSELHVHDVPYYEVFLHTHTNCMHVSIHIQSHQWMSQSMCCHQDKEHSQ